MEFGITVSQIGEARFVTPEVMRKFCIAGEPDDIIRQLQALESDGLTGINFIAPAARQHEVCEAFATKVIRQMRN